MLMVLTDFSMSVRSPFRLQPHQSRLLKGTSKGALWTIQTPERTLRCAIARIRSGSGASAGHRWPGLQLLGQPKPAVRSIAKPFPGAILRPLAPASPRSLWERREASSAFEVAPDGSGGGTAHTCLLPVAAVALALGFAAGCLLTKRAWPSMSGWSRCRSDSCDHGTL